MNFSPFHFKKFSVLQEDVAHAVGTDGVLLGAWADVSGAQNILDVGTGTGLIALMLAQRTHGHVPITAIDIHTGSVTCACKNFQLSPWGNQLQAKLISIQALADAAEAPFDLIVSNPPFFSETTVSPNQHRVLSRSTDSLPLPALAASMARLMAPNGRCCLILPTKEAHQLAELAVPLGLYPNKQTVLFSKPEKPMDRMLLQLGRDPGRCTRDTLVLFVSNGEKSEAYQQLGADFYLDNSNPADQKEKGN